MADEAPAKIVLIEKIELKKMTLEEKNGQLFIVRSDAMQVKLLSEQTGYLIKNGVTEFNETMNDIVYRFK